MHRCTKAHTRSTDLPKLPPSGSAKKEVTSSFFGSPARRQCVVLLSFDAGLSKFIIEVPVPGGGDPSMSLFMPSVFIGLKPFHLLPCATVDAVVELACGDPGGEPWALARTWVFARTPLGPDGPLEPADPLPPPAAIFLEGGASSANKLIDLF